MDALAGSWLFQASDPTTVFDLPGHARGPAAFVVVLCLGSMLLWRFGPLVERSLDASLERPLSSLAYGIAAHLTILFFSVYAASQLGRVAPSGSVVAGVGLWAGTVLLAIAAALGFTVVGAAVLEFTWEPRRWYGLLVGAAMAGLAGLVEPVFGVVVWTLVVSTGIGGSVRTWFNAAEDVDSVG